MVHDLVNQAKMQGQLADYKCYPTRVQLFYINKVLLLSLKAEKVAQVAVDEVRKGRSVVIGMSDTLECILKDVTVSDDGMVRGDISALLLRLLEKTVRSTSEQGDNVSPIFDFFTDSENPELLSLSSIADEIRDYYKYTKQGIKDEVFHLPMSPIDVIRQLITQERFVSPDGSFLNIRFEECTGRGHQLEYLSPEGNDVFVNAKIMPRKKRHSNHIFNDFQNNNLDVILINACGAIGASAHAISTTEVPDEQVRQRKMLIVQNDLDVNIDLQKRGRINRTGQRMDLPPLYEYIITAIPSEKRLNMMLRAKLRSLSANTAAWQDQDREQVDFIDISNKYGNEVASEYIGEHPELALVLGLKGTITAGKLLARLAMLSVTAQKDIIDDLMAAYTALEAELRRINQWDLEREFRDFEAEFVQEELFTTAKAESTLGGCSYLSVYKCKQKTFPYSYRTLMEYCEQARKQYEKTYNENPLLQKQVRNYYARHNKVIRKQFKERQSLLYGSAKRVLVDYCSDEKVAGIWLQRAYISSDDWDDLLFDDVAKYKKAKHIMRKLVSFSNEYNHLIEREKKELKKKSAEKKRLVEVLTKAIISKGYNNISSQLGDEDRPGNVMAVLRDIQFGKEDKNKFLPSRVEFVFALTAVYTEIRFNLVHNSKWSNYERLLEILNSDSMYLSKQRWQVEIAANNNKIVECKIITGNILGAFVHPAIVELRPRFITFSLKAKVEGESITQTGLLLPKDESKIREAIKTVSIPLNEGIKYATKTNTSYTIAGLSVKFSLLPYRISDSLIKFVISVLDTDSKTFESEKSLDGIRTYFVGSAIISIYDKIEKGTKQCKNLMHYQTEPLYFESESFQTIIQVLSQMDAVIIVPRYQITYGDVKELVSRSERDSNEPWGALDWKNSNEIPMPPLKEKLLLRISAPIIQKSQKGKPVFKHSEHYNLSKETIALEGQPLNSRSTMDALRRNYMNWKAYYSRSVYQRNNLQKDQPSLAEIREICHELRIVNENKDKAVHVKFKQEIQYQLQAILDSEYLEPNGLYVTRFEEEMLFSSPDKKVAQAFIDEMPYSPRLDGIRQCIQENIDGKTDNINSPDIW